MKGYTITIYYISYIKYNCIISYHIISYHIKLYIHNNSPDSGLAEISQCLPAGHSMRSIWCINYDGTISTVTKNLESEKNVFFNHMTTTKLSCHRSPIFPMIYLYHRCHRHGFSAQASRARLCCSSMVLNSGLGST